MKVIAISCLLPFLIFKVPVDSKLLTVEHRIKSLPGAVAVNSGGCGFFALYMHDHLNRANISNQIVFVPGKHGIKHVAIRVKDFYIDGNGLITAFAMNVFALGQLKPITRQQLLEELKKGQWNSRFNLSDTVTIKKILE